MKRTYTYIWVVLLVCWVIDSSISIYRHRDEVMKVILANLVIGAVVAVLFVLWGMFLNRKAKPPKR